MHRVDANAERPVAHRRRLRIDPHRALRGAIGGVAAGAADKPHDRADVDDRAAAGLCHLLGGELGAEKDAGLVDRDDPVPAVEPVRVADRTAGNPGVVDQDVEPAVGRERLGDQCLPLRLAGDVDLCRAGLAAGIADLGRDALRLAAENVGDHDFGAFLREQTRLGLAHAVAGPGDDRDLVLEAHWSLPAFAGSIVYRRPAQRALSRGLIPASASRRKPGSMRQPSRERISGSRLSPGRESYASVWNLV